MKKWWNHKFMQSKLLAENAIISSNYNIYMLPIDMPKAYVDRSTLFEHLEAMLNEDEIYILPYLPETNQKLQL